MIDVLRKIFYSGYTPFMWLWGVLFFVIFTSLFFGTIDYFRECENIELYNYTINNWYYKFAVSIWYYTSIFLVFVWPVYCTAFSILTIIRKKLNTKLSCLAILINGGYFLCLYIITGIID